MHVCGPVVRGTRSRGSNATIATVLQESATAGQACQTLVDLALKQGGKDNVTVVLARYRVSPEG